MEILGIDIGGSGIKGALVDIEKGEFTTERYRIPTPTGAKPDDVAQVVAELVRYFDYNGAIGCTFPAIMKNGVAHSAANVDKAWIGTDAQALFQQATGCPVIVLNDADAAGIAEMTFGAGKNREDLVFILTLGTGIGSAIFNKGHLMPNSELGHMEVRGKQAEHRAASRIKDEEQLSWKKWGGRVNEVLQKIDFLFSPDLFILGGGVSKRHEKFFPYLSTNAEIVPAVLRNKAGIIGAAMAAKDLS